MDEEEEQVRINTSRRSRPLKTLGDDFDLDNEDEEEEVKINVSRRKGPRKTIEDYCPDPEATEAALEKQFEQVVSKAEKQEKNPSRAIALQYKEYRDATVPADRLLKLVASFVAPAKLEQRKVANWAGFQFLEDAWLVRLGLVPHLADLYHFTATFDDGHSLCTLSWDENTVPKHSQKPWTIVSIQLNFSKDAHANVLLINNIYKTGFLFEPHGRVSQDTYDTLFNVFKRALPDLTFLRMPMKEDGPQVQEIRSSVFEKLAMMRRGACSIWCLLFAHLVILHGLHPFQTMLHLCRLEPNAALFTSRGYTSTVMSEFYDASSPFRRALPADTRTWPEFEQNMLDLSTGEKKQQQRRSKQEKKAPIERKLVSDSLHPAEARKKKRERAEKRQEKEEAKKETITTFKIPFYLDLIPFKDGMDAFQLHISYADWVWFTGQDKVDGWLNDTKKHWDPSNMKLILVNHFPTSERSKTTILEQTTLTGRYVTSKRDVSAYYFTNNGLPIADINWTFDKLEGIKIGSGGNSKLFQLHLRLNADDAFASWKLYDIWKGETKLRGVPLERNVKLLDNLLQPPLFSQKAVNLYSYWLSFDQGVEYPMPAEKADRTFVKVMKAHAATVNVLQTETQPYLVRSYKFSSFELGTVDDLQYLYSEFERQRDVVMDIKWGSKTRSKLEVILPFIDALFQIKLEHFKSKKTKPVSLLINKSLDAFPLLKQKTLNIAPYNFSSNGYLLKQAKMFFKLYSKMPIVLRLAVVVRPSGPRTTLLRYLLRAMNKYTQVKPVDARYKYWIRYGYSAPPSQSQIDAYNQIFNI